MNIIDKWLHESQDGYSAVERRYKGRFGASPKIIVLHIQEGNNWGSWQHFHAVKASSTVFVGKNGDIWRLVPELDAPWTNGDVRTPTSLGWEIINKWGPDPNVYTLSIETEGFTNEWPKPEVQIASVVWQIATWMKTYGIPLKYVVRHAEINSVDRPNCPGNAFYNEVIRRLSEGIEVEAKPVYASPSKVMVDGKAWTGITDATIKKATFHADTKQVKIAVDALKVRQFATTTSPETHKPLNLNDSLSVLGWVEGESVEGESRWWITKHFSRVWVGGTVEKPSIEVKLSKPEVLPEGVKIVNGRVYYPTFENGSKRTVKVIGKANIRLEPSLQSEAVGVAQVGEELAVKYWTFGDEVKDERIWWLLDATDPFKNPKHLWIASTNERPS